MSRMLQHHVFRAIFSALFVVILLAASAAWTQARAAGKKIGPSYIPQKRLAKQVRYRQAPAYDKLSKSNRRLVTKTREAGRELRRTGSAYEND